MRENETFHFSCSRCHHCINTLQTSCDWRDLCYTADHCQLYDNWSYNVDQKLPSSWSLRCQCYLQVSSSVIFIDSDDEENLCLQKLIIFHGQGGEVAGLEKMAEF